MKKYNLFISFLPWIIFSANLTTFLNSAIIAFILNLLISRKDLLRGVVLEIGGVLFFGAMIVIGYFFPAGNTFTHHPNLWSNIAMTVIMLGSVLINRPFTKQYTDQGSLAFHRQLSAIWGFLLLAATIVSIAHAYFGLNNTLSTVGTVVAIVLGIKANEWYPRWYLENLRKKSQRKNRNNPFLKDDFAPVLDELDVSDLNVIGKIPDDLFGVYMRNGPNPQFPPISYTYPFDGDGMIHAVYIENGKARYKNRFVLTDALIAERRAGRALYSGIMLPIPPDPKLIDKNAEPYKNGAFIHIIRHAQKYLSMSEAAPAYEINSELKTKGLWCPGTEKPLPASPHTRLCPKTGELWMINYDIVPPYLSIYCLDAAGKLKFRKDIDKEHSTMMHDFVLTENYVIVYECPVIFDLKAAASGKNFINWRPELGLRIGIMSRKTNEMKWFTTEAFFVFHFANAYEKGSQIMIDFVHHQDFALVDSSVFRKPPTLYRSIIDLESKTIKHEAGDDRLVEFPRIREDHNSYHHQYVYTPTKTISTDRTAPFNALIKYDVEKKISTLHDFGKNAEIGEAVFAPKINSQSEDDGYLMLFVYYKDENNSELVILNAKELSDEPLARIKMPRRIPHGLHGSWMPGAWE